MSLYRTLSHLQCVELDIDCFDSPLGVGIEHFEEVFLKSLEGVFINNFEFIERQKDKERERTRH